MIHLFRPLSCPHNITRPRLNEKAPANRGRHWIYAGFSYAINYMDYLTCADVRNLLRTVRRTVYLIQKPEIRLLQGSGPEIVGGSFSALRRTRKRLTIGYK